MKEEIYKIYKKTIYHGKERIYEVSNYGNVKLNGEQIDFSQQNCTYYGFAGNFVHRIVAELFIPNPENKPVIDHIDRNTHNNCVSNLRWCTQGENLLNPGTRKALSDALKGRKFSDETKQKMSKSQTGKKLSKSTRLKMSANSIGNTYVKGRIHINNGSISKMIYPDELEQYLNLGFELGRKKFNNSHKNYTIS